MGDDYSTDRLDAATDVIFDHLIGEGVAATLTPKQREYWRDVLTKARIFEPQPLAASGDLTAILAAADQAWSREFGDQDAEPPYIRHLVRCVTAGRALPYEPSGEGPCRVGGYSPVNVWFDPQRGEKTGVQVCMATEPHWAKTIVAALNARFSAGAPNQTATEEVADTELADLVYCEIDRHTYWHPGKCECGWRIAEAGDVDWSLQWKQHVAQTIVDKHVAPALRRAYLDGHDSGFAAATVPDPWAKEPAAAGVLRDRVIRAIASNQSMIPDEDDASEWERIRSDADAVLAVVAPMLAAKDSEIAGMSESKGHQDIETTMGDGPYRVGYSWGVTIVYDPEGGENTGKLWATAQSRDMADYTVDALNAWNRSPVADSEVSALRAELRIEEDNVQFAERALHLVLGCCDPEINEDCPGRVREVYDALREGRPVPYSVTAPVADSDLRQQIERLSVELQSERESRQDWAAEAMRLDVEVEEHRFKLNDALGIVGAEEDTDPYQAVVGLHEAIDRLRAERDEAVESADLLRGEMINLGDLPRQLKKTRGLTRGLVETLLERADVWDNEFGTGDGAPGPQFRAVVDQYFPGLRQLIKRQQAGQPDTEATKQAEECKPTADPLQSVAEIESPATPTEPRPIRPAYDDPGNVEHENDEDDNPYRHYVGWSIAWGCRVTIARENGEYDYAVSISDDVQRDGIAVRTVTREQIRKYAYELIQLTEVVEGQSKAPTEPRVWRKGDPEPDGVHKVRDHMGDVWSPRPFGLWETPETRPASWNYIAKKWGPLTEVVEDGTAEDTP